MLKSLPRVFYLVYAVLRIVIQILQLFWLVHRGNYDCILVQNPPCVPILFVIVVYRWLQIPFCQQTRLIIDWHNYGFTIMQANSVNGLLCSMARVYEQFLGQFANQNLTVSEAFKKDMAKNFGVETTRNSVLYDRAVKGKFKTLTILEKH